MRLGELVASERKRLDYTQEQLGKLAGVSREQISKIEHNRADRPSYDQIKDIARALAMPPEVLLAAAGYTVEMPPPSPRRSMVLILRQALAIAEELERRGHGVGDDPSVRRHAHARAAVAV